MRTFELPKSISSLAEELQLVEIVWQDVPAHIPKFAVYAVIKNPVFVKITKRNGRQIGMLDVGRYHIPVINPFYDDSDFSPNYALTISHIRDNAFGLYGYPADHIDMNIQLPNQHKAVTRIVRNYV